MVTYLVREVADISHLFDGNDRKRDLDYFLVYTNFLLGTESILNMAGSTF